MASKTVLAVAAALGCSMLSIGGGTAWADSSANTNATQPDQGATDTRITGEVRNKLDRDFPDWAGRIQVTTQNGVVTLSGYAETAIGEQKAIEDARAVSGVTDVRNELRVVS